MKLTPVKEEKKERDDSVMMDLKTIAKEGQLLEDIRMEIENEINESLNRITHYQIGYETQLNKWNKLSANQQNLSSLMIQLKNVQSVWKLQLKINLQINKLSKLYGFNQITNNDNNTNNNNNDMFQLCINIINDIHTMIEKSDKCIIQIQMIQKQNNKKYEDNTKSLSDIMDELHSEITLYSEFIIEIIQFAFNSIVQIQHLDIKIKSRTNLKKLSNCIDKLDKKSYIEFVDSLLCHNIFGVIFDGSLSSLFKLGIKQQKKSQFSSLKIDKMDIESVTENEHSNLLCSNVDNLIKIIEWIKMNILSNNETFYQFWIENYLFPSMDNWIILWINLNTPILSSLLFVPDFKIKKNKFNEIQHSAIQHITSSISYQKNIENVLNSLQKIMEDNKTNSSKIYLKKSLELLETNDENENQYGLSSKILSEILPSKIREFIFESIRNKIKGHDYESFDPLNLQIFDKIIIDEQDNNKMIKYNDLIKQSESFFRKQPCQISITMFEIVIIIYNICIFIEQMYYIDGDGNGNNNDQIVSLSTMYVDLFMNICRNIIQLWMSLTISYHKKYLYDVSSLGFQFYNDCSFLSFNLLQLSIKTNHGNLLITDNIKTNLKYLWFTDYIQLLKSLGKQYFIYHLHNQRQTILKSLSNINKFNDIAKPQQFQSLKQNFSESLISISQFLNSSRSIIPDSLLYQIGEKLLKCICNSVIDEISKSVHHSDIGMTAAHNISLIIKHIEIFDILSNDIEYLTRNISKTWNKFIKIGDILHKDQSLSSLTIELNNGEFDNLFTKQDLTQLICALFDESDKRSKFIQDINNRL